MDLGLSFMEDTTLASRLAQYYDSLHPDEPALTLEGTARDQALLFRSQWSRIEHAFQPLHPITTDTDSIIFDEEEETVV